MEKEKELYIEDWLEMSHDLRKTYKTYLHLRKHCIKVFGVEHFSLKDFPDEKAVVIEPSDYTEGGRMHDRMHGNRDYPLYEGDKEGKLRRFSSEEMVNKLAPVLAKHVDREMLMKDVLFDLPPTDLRDIYERVIKTKEKGKEAKITSSPKCFYLSIGGKPGAPEQLFIRN